MASGRRVIAWGLVGVVAVAGRVVAVDGPSTGATAPGAVVAGRWGAVVRGLASEKVADRDAAQAVLDTATWRDEPALRALAEAATDAEGKARLEKRVNALDLEGLVHPTPVSLEVKDAGIGELVAALTAATGSEWTGWGGGGSEGRWGLTAKDRPLWEIFEMLEKQSGLHVQNSGGQVELAAGPMIPGGLGPIDGDWTDVVAGDFLIYAGVGRQVGPVGLFAAGQARVPTVKIEYGVDGDPRMRFVRCGIPEILSVVDEKGNTLFAAAPRATPLWMPVTGIMPEVNTAMGFDDVAAMGKLLTIKGRMVERMATATERVEIPELTSQASTPVVAGGRAWQRWAVPPLGQQDQWVINLTELRAGAGVPLAFVPMSVKLIGADGKVVWDGVVDQRASVRVQAGTLKGPLRAVIVAAKETKDEEVGFEIKDVPVPAAR